MHTLQCQTVIKTRRFGLVNQTKSEGSVVRTKTPSFGRVLVLSTRPDVSLLSPKHGRSSGFWSGQQTRQTLVTLCLVNRTKTPRFSHSSTLQGVHVRTNNTFFGV
ncbi:hypothetical protein Hanom_Chr10g00900691 [Helianthus anomalus]